MVDPALLAIAAILILQPLIALLWVYVVYRLVVNYTVSRAEEAVDGRIDRATQAVQDAARGTE